MKFNPFQPYSMVAPGMFAGRVDEIDVIERSLFQTKGSNPHHFLIQGERGIGKSSLFYFVELVASGKIDSADKTKLHFVTISIDLNGCRTQLDIVRAIARGLRTAMGEVATLRDRAKQVWDFLKSWEVLGVAYHGDEHVDALEDARDTLIAQVTDLCNRMGDQIDGVLILIDEADSPSAEAGLGEFVKLFTERLHRRGCDRILLGMAGLPSAIGKMKESHESSPRIFQVFSLQPLEPVERAYVVQRGLDRANEQNAEKTSITQAALLLICELSEGYPHFLQQFAYSGFEEDSDGTIDVNDVERGAFKENGALAQLGVKYFNELYNARINSEDYRRVLDAIADHGDEPVSRAQIIQETPTVTEHNIGNALAALKSKGIILQEEGKRGYYRLPTKSFAAWINALKAARNKTGEIRETLFDQSLTES